MYGPAGCGKSHTAKQVAESLNLDFYETSTVLFAHDMKGYGDANGHFVETPFYKAFANGGLFFLDEVDASAPDALVVLNTAIANGRFDFPVVGNVQAHKNFRVMAAGNTLMTGADLDYTARAVQDKSFINRFFFVGFDYDLEIEKAITNNDTELIEFAHDFRNAAQRAGLSVCLSYRQLEVLANKELQNAWGLDQLVKNSFLSCLSPDDINVIAANMTTTKKWSTAVKNLCK
jgi:MoxR-like ATPases